jgi:hypothetical protein
MNKLLRILLIVYAKLTNKTVVHFLHIGKTGGSAIKNSIGEIKLTPTHLHIFHPHDIILSDIPKKDKIAFFLRNPITRFTSGFYSRKRQGKPLYDTPWHEEERIAFSNFDTPNQLAEAISSSDKHVREKGIYAMNNIHHVKTTYNDWFGDIKHFKSRQHDIFFIGFLENFEKDFKSYCKKIGLFDVSLEKSEVKSHKAPPSEIRELSPIAIENLKDWYKDDIFFFNYCQQLKKSE